MQFGGHDSLKSALVVVLVGSLSVTSACASISTETHQEQRSAGIEEVELDPRYETKFSTRLSDDTSFEEANLEVEVEEEKTCRHEVVELREDVVHTERKISNSEVVLTNGTIAAASVACSIGQFNESPCISESEDEATGQDEPLSDEALKGWGVGFGVLGAAAGTAVIVDLLRAVDTTEVVATDERTKHTEEEPCGSEPAEGALVEVYAPEADTPYTTRTNEKGSASIPLKELALHDVEPGTPIGRIVVGDQESRADSLPSRWADSKDAFYDDELFEEAAEENTPAAYLDYLRSFGDGEHATEAHRQLQQLFMKRENVDELQAYLEEFGDDRRVREHTSALEKRLDDLRVDKAYRNYVRAWDRDGTAQEENLDSRRAQRSLRERLFEFHRDRIEASEEEESGFDRMRTHHRAAIELAPDDGDEQEARRALTKLLLERADKLRTADGSDETDNLLNLYDEAYETAADSPLDEEAANAALAFVIEVFEERLPEEFEPDDDLDEAEQLLARAKKYARGDDEKERVERVEAEYADRRVRGLLAAADELAEREDGPLDDEIVGHYEQALELPSSEDLAQQTREAYLHYLADSLKRRVEGSDGVTGDRLPADDIMERGLDIAEDQKEADILRTAWVEVFADKAEAAIEQSTLEEVATWHVWFGLADYRADSEAAEALLAERREKLEAKLRERFPPSDLDTAREAVIAYPPTIDPDDQGAMHRAFDNPGQHKGERLATSVEIETKVGRKFLARTEGGKEVFVEPSSDQAHARLDSGQTLGVLAEIAGTIPHRRGGDRVYLPRLEIIWVDPPTPSGWSTY